MCIIVSSIPIVKSFYQYILLRDNSCLTRTKPGSYLRTIGVDFPNHLVELRLGRIEADRADDGTKLFTCNLLILVIVEQEKRLSQL